MQLDVGMLQYLYIKALKEIKMRKDNQENNKIAEILSEL